MQYGIIGNSSTAALVHKNGSIDWCCLPRFDSPSAFAALLDPDGGCFGVTSVGAAVTRQSYVAKTAILRTEFEHGEESFAVIDFMPRYRDGQTCRRPLEIHRILKPLRGRPAVRVRFEPRLNYSRGETRVTRTADTIIAVNGLEDLFLYSSLPLDKIVAGEPVALEEDHYLLLTYHEKLDPPNLAYVNEMFEKTREHWEAWSGETRLPSLWNDHVIRSAITLKLLTYESTGAMVAAVTTSIPEIIGEGRNWDYRYCWLRDASLVLESLKSVGHFDEARGFIGFLLNILESKQSKVQIVYRVDGSTDLDEKTMPSLRGYRGSKPVRIGNNACRTRQNDIFGEILNSVHLYYHHYELEHMPREVWSLVKFLVSTVVRDWANPDAGIWEFRHRPRHFTHSKMLSWVALDRGVQIAKRIGRDAVASEWAPLADTIRADIFRRGWKDRVGSFTQTYGSSALDISLLQATRYGFLDPADPRWIGTVRSCEQSLCRDGVVLRYTNPDDFGTPKNGFVLASFWMANALHTIGERQKAIDLAETTLARANHLGLLSEDIDAQTGELLGNFPQAYSHLAVVNTANLLGREES